MTRRNERRSKRASRFPGNPHSVRSVLSIARGSRRNRNSVGVTCSLTALALIEQIGHSYEVTESLGIAVLSRGHSYGVAALFQQPARRAHSAATAHAFRLYARMKNVLSPICRFGS